MDPGARTAPLVGHGQSGGDAGARGTNPASPLHDVNERCIEMLAQAARKEPSGAFSLITHLKAQLLRVTPKMRTIAARRAILLINLEFANAPWWRELRDYPTRPAPLPNWRGSFPRAAGVQLARATLMLAWHTVRSDRQHAPFLGIIPPVAEVLSDLSPTEIDLIAERRFRHLRPRWEDRPAVWSALLRSAEHEDLRRTRDFNLYSLQLLTGELWQPVSARDPA